VEAGVIYAIDIKKNVFWAIKLSVLIVYETSGTKYVLIYIKVKQQQKEYLFTSF